jgi:hypothetical protein
VHLQIIETYGPAGLLIVAFLAVIRLLIARGFRLSFKAEVPKRGARSE